ncbi:MAG: MFS transporter [Micrococcus sp.]|nr:MFS transporter [Micrococcus sp.]
MQVLLAGGVALYTISSDRLTWFVANYAIVATIAFCATITLRAIATENVKEGEKRRVYRLQSAGLSVQSIIAPPLGAILAARFGYEAAYLGNAVGFMLAAACFIAVRATVHVGTETIGGTSISSKSQGKAETHGIRLVLAGWCVATIGWAVFVAVQQPYIVETLQLSLSNTGWLLMVAGAGGITSMVINSRPGYKGLGVRSALTLNVVSMTIFALPWGQPYLAGIGLFFYGLSFTEAVGGIRLLAEEQFTGRLEASVYWHLHQRTALLGNLIGYVACIALLGGVLSVNLTVMILLAAVLLIGVGFLLRFVPKRTAAPVPQTVGS